MKKEEFEKLLDHQSAMIVCWDAKTSKRTYVNKAFCSAFGLPKEEFIGRHIEHNLPEDQHELIRNNIKKITSDNPMLKSMFQWEDAEGNKHYQEWETTGIFDAEGQVLSYQTVGVDVTDLVIEQIKNKETREKLDLALQFGGVGEYNWKIEGDQLYWSPTMYDIFQVTPEDFSPSVQNYLEFLEENYREEFLKTIEGFIENPKDEVYEIEHKAILRSGEVKWILLRANLVLNEQGEAERFPGVAIDVTKSKEEDLILRELRTDLDWTMEVARVGSFEQNLKTGKITWSDQLYNMYNIEKEDFDGSFEKYIQLVPEEERDYIFQKMGAAIESKSKDTVEAENRILRPKGDPIWIQTRARLRFDENGVPESFLGLVVDITRQKEVENQLVDALAEVNKLKGELEQENLYLKEEISFAFNYEDLVYASSEFSEVLSEVERVSPTDATVLIGGETGTGKELIARAIHNTSLRKDKPLIKVNCAAIPRELIESELFGHKKGSFTGAVGDKMGKFELANGGTIFWMRLVSCQSICNLNCFVRFKRGKSNE